MEQDAETMMLKRLLVCPTAGRRIRTARFPKFWAAVCIAALALPFINCGGGDGGGSSQGPQNPAPTLTSISPTSAPAGSRAITLTVRGYDFMSGSVVRWGGSDRTTVYVSSSQLTASIPPADLSIAGTQAVTVFNPAPGGGQSAAKNFTVSSVSPLTFLTTRLPDAHHSKAYDYTLQASGGIPPYSWSVSQGVLPSGLSLSSGGTVSGTPPAVSGDTAVNFSIQIGDDAYQPNTAAQPFSILVHASGLGRNETCSTATPISNGVLRASLSPFGDIDVYAFQATAGQKVTIEIYAQRLDEADSELDSFLELLDSSCTRLFYNDDIYTGDVLDSKISGYTLPNTGTYYIRVSELRGDGRPDLVYELHLTVAN